MATYQLDLCDLSGSVVVSDILDVYASGDLRYSNVLNGPGGIDFRLPTRYGAVTQANFAVGQRTLKLYRDASLIWAGYLLTAQGDRDWVSFGGQGWYFGLRCRLVSQNLNYKDDPVDDIAWDLINWTQTVRGTLGITRGTDTGTFPNRNRHWCKDDFITVAECIEDLAAQEVGGFDFWLTPAKAWNTMNPRRGTDLSGSVVFNAGTNVTELDYAQDATNLVTALWYNDDANCGWVDVVEENTGTYGVLESGTDLSSIKQDTDRADRATGRLARMSTPTSIPSATIPAELGIEPGDFDLGDTVRVVASDGWLTLDSHFRVIEYDVRVAEGCVEEMTVRLDALDAA